MVMDSGIRSVMCFGHFSTIHSGHIRYLKFARSLGLEVWVALRGDAGEDRFEFAQPERKEAIEYLGLVDKVICLERDEIRDVIGKYKPDVVLFGSEFVDSTIANEASSAVSAYGGSVKFHSGSTGQTSSDLIGKSEWNIKAERRKQFLKILDKLNISCEDIEESISGWTKGRILVIGDTIVDQFAACQPIGISA